MDVDYIRPCLTDQSPQGAVVEVGVSVHVSSALHGEFDDAERLHRKLRLRTLVRPPARHYQGYVDACRHKRALAVAVPRIPPAW